MLLWRYVITCSNLHVAFVAGAAVAILLLFMLFFFLNSWDTVVCYVRNAVLAVAVSVAVT